MTSSPNQLSPGQLFDQAIQERHLGDQRNVESFCRQAVALDPNFADAWHLLGVAQRDQKNLAGAIQAITRACNLRNDADFFVSLGDCYRLANQLAPAAECCRRAIAIKPDHALAHLNLGNILLMTARTADAADAFRAALHVSPYSGEGYYGLGVALMRLDDPTHAADAFTQAVEISPWEARYWFELGEARLRSKQTAGAIECYTRTLRIDPTHTFAAARIDEIHKC